MFKWICRVGFFFFCLLVSIQGFSAQIITVSGEGGGLGIVGPQGETFVFYGDANGEVSIKECLTNRTFFEKSRYDCVEKEGKGTEIETLSQADFRNHLKFVLNWLPIQNYDATPQVNLELWRKSKPAAIDINKLRRDQDGIKVHLAQIERVILAYGAESANMEEKQALESKLASIELQLEAHAGFDEFDHEVNQWINGLMAAIMSSQAFVVYNFAQHKRNFDFNVLRGVIQTPTYFSKHTNNFIRVKSGSFLMGSPSSETGRDSDEYQHSVTLEYAFEMQATEETQWRWVHVMGYNPSRFQKEEHCSDTHKEIEIKGHKVSLCPTHPVEQVSWWSVVVYANRLSELRGLAPVYDLSDMEFEGTAAEGTLKATRGELRINAPDDNIYNTKGFRLPTEAEWEYAARGGTTTAFGPGENIFVDMANYNGRSPYRDAAKGIYRKQTVSVMSLSSLNGFGFSHMHGNVWEWAHDWYNSKYYYDSPEKNPLGPLGGSGRILRGGGWWGSSAGYLRSANRAYDRPGDRSDTVGFRLMRTAQ